MPLVISVVAVCILWLAYWFVVTRLMPFTDTDRTSTWAARGQFGDMFGAFTALITSFGFAGLLYTIHLERKDLQRQHAVLKRQELYAAISAQLATLVQIHGMPDARRDSVWRAIASAPGGPGADFPIETAIAIQIEYLDRLATDADLKHIPTYGRPSRTNRNG